MARTGVLSPWSLLEELPSGESHIPGSTTGPQSAKLGPLDLVKRAFATASSATVAPFGPWLLVSGVLVVYGFGLGREGMAGRVEVLQFRASGQGVLGWYWDLDWMIPVQIIRLRLKDFFDSEFNETIRNRELETWPIACSFFSRIFQRSI